MEGKFAEAHSFYKAELELRRKVVGEDSLQVAITLTNLAGKYFYYCYYYHFYSFLLMLYLLGLYADMGSSKDLIAERCLNKAMMIYETRRPDSNILLLFH